MKIYNSIQVELFDKNIDAIVTQVVSAKTSLKIEQAEMENLQLEEQPIKQVCRRREDTHICLITLIQMHTLPSINI